MYAVYQEKLSYIDIIIDRFGNAGNNHLQTPPFALLQVGNHTLILSEKRQPTDFSYTNLLILHSLDLLKKKMPQCRTRIRAGIEWNLHPQYNLKCQPKT
jgi:hypothetical protein